MQGIRKAQGKIQQAEAEEVLVEGVRVEKKELLAAVAAAAAVEESGGRCCKFCCKLTGFGKV